MGIRGSQLLSAVLEIEPDVLEFVSVGLEIEPDEDVGRPREPTTGEAGRFPAGGLRHARELPGTFGVELPESSVRPLRVANMVLSASEKRHE